MKTVPNRIVSRFWNRVKVLGPDECWPWIGKSATYEPDPNKRGGIAWMEAGEKRQYLAHVLSWMIEHDQAVPEGLMVRHLCHSPSCCNPKHLKVGTFGDNVQDNIDAGKHWGKPGPKNDAVDEMHMLRDSGFSITQIAEQVGWSRSAVWRHLNK
jgi:hypothetical protein